MDKLEQRETIELLADLNYGIDVIRDELKEEGREEEAERLLTAYNTIDYIITEHFKRGR
jgi:hypothetical protein